MDSTGVFFLDAFAARQFDGKGTAGCSIDCDKEAFVDRCHKAHAAGAALVDGYAPFCKHIFIPNSVGAKVGALTITAANKHLLCSGYTRRRPEELPVLTRWFPASAVEVPAAAFLDVILYSRAQLVKEYADMPVKGAGEELPQEPWGIISIKAQEEGFETPMAPITMLRNALGREEGGSGVPLDREAYEASVRYWDTHATVLEGDAPDGE
ncbi:MAG: hypothetical protein WDW38_001180 [Sanguina aurantia]